MLAAIGIIVVIAIVAAALVATGKISTSTAKRSPQAQLEAQLNELNSTGQVHVAYLIRMPSLSKALSGELGANTNITADIYKSGSRSKLLISVGSLGGVAIYSEGNNSIICSELNLGLFGNATCGVVSSSTLSPGLGLAAKLRQMANSTAVSVGGTESFVGNSCTDYVILANQSQLDQLASSADAASSTAALSSGLTGQIGDNGSVRIDMCMSGRGIPLEFNITEISPPQQGGSAAGLLLSVVATNVSYSVPSGAFNIPVSYAVQNVSCGKGSISAKVFSFANSSGGYSVGVVIPEYSKFQELLVTNDTGNATIPGPVRFGSEYNINMTLQTPLNTSEITPMFCVNGKCRNVLCSTYSIYNSSSSYAHAATTTAATTTIPVPGNETLSSLLASSPTFGSVADFVDSRFNAYGTLTVNYSYNSSTEYGGTGSYTSTLISNTSIVKYYNNETMYISSPNVPKIADFYPNGSDTYHLCDYNGGAAPNDYSCIRYSSRPFGLMESMTNFIYEGNTGFMVTDGGQRTFNGQQCTMVYGSSDVNYTSSFSACISNEFGIPLNLTTRSTNTGGITSMETYTETSISAGAGRPALP